MSLVDSMSTEYQRPHASNALLTPAQHFQRALDVPIMQLIGMLLVFTVSFLNLVNVQVDKEVVALDSQVLLKLMVVAAAGLYGFWGVMDDPRIRRVLLSFPMFLMLLLVGFYFVSSFISIQSTQSLASTISLLSILLMTVTGMVKLGLVRFLTIAFHAMSAFILLSWVVYFVWPEVGVFMEPIANGEFTPRMSGLAHANTLGQYAGLTTVLGVALYQFYGQRSVWRLVVIALALAALLGSLSRTSTIAMLAGLIAVYGKSIFTPANTKWILSAGVFVLMGLVLVSTQVDFGEIIEEKMTVVSKSGDAEELTSATGRADIWQYACYLISKQPLTGYGAATSKYYLEDHSLYTHNLLLNIAFSTGIFGGLVALAMILHQAWTVVWRHHLVASAAVTFILVNGLFENVIFSIIVGMPTMIWIMAMAWDQVAQINGDEFSVRPLSAEERLA